ncbi:MAG: hypothetical protein DRJ69_03105 [Thermoprotei archaeon]|nr:MAG: hypothetical protein DRJ69_03105 [Thermoprotei archaeon]
MEYEEAYYYFAIFLGKKMKHIADYDEGMGGWEVFWSEAEDGKTEGFNAFEEWRYKLEMAIRTGQIE